MDQFNQFSNQINEEFEQNVEEAKDEHNEIMKQIQEEYNQGLEKVNQLMQ